MLLLPRRVWSTDWWYDAAGCTDRLHQALEELLDKSRADAGQPETSIVDHQPIEFEVVESDGTRENQTVIHVEDVLPASAEVEVERIAPDAPLMQPVRIAGASPSSTLVSAPSPALGDDRYRITDLTSFLAEPENFFAFTYRDTLKAMITSVVDTESPMRTDILCQRIARAHGWLRTGAKIRERIDMHLRDFDRTHESSGEFIWKLGAVSEIRAFRPPASEEARRAIPDIPIAELAAVVQTNLGLLDEPDPARELARILGVERLAAGSRARLDEAIARGRGGEARTIPTATLEAQ